VGGGNLPPSLLNTRLDALPEFGVVLLGEPVHGHLALAVVELRELVHESVHGREGVHGDAYRLGPAPQPVHVYVAVTAAVDRIGLRLVTNRRKEGLCLTDDGTEVQGTGRVQRALEQVHSSAYQAEPFLCRPALGLARESCREPDLGKETIGRALQLLACGRESLQTAVKVEHFT